MEFPKKSSARGCQKGLSTQKCECQSCSASNQEICGLCGNQVPSLSLSDEMVIDNRPDTCQCFLSYSSEIGNQEEASEQKTELPSIQISDSQNLNLLSPIKEISHARVESSNISMKSDMDNSEESKTLSTGYAMSPGDLSDRSFAGNTTTTPSSEEDSKMNTNNCAKKLDQNENESNSGPFTSKDEHADNQKERGRGASDFDYTMRLRSNKSAQNKNVSVVSNEPRVRNLNVRFQAVRPPIPRPFSHPYRQYINPVPRPFTRMHQPYVIPIMPTPVIHTNAAVARFSVLPHQRHNVPGYQQRPNAAEGLEQPNDRNQQLQSQLERIRKFEMVTNWLNNVENVPPSEEPSSNDMGAIRAENENERFFPSVSTDERSSTEISEEENRRQRGSRRPPRYSKRNRRK